MSKHRITGYTDSKELKQDVQRAKNDPDTPWNSESELIIHAVRKLLGEREAEEKAAEYNVERRIEQKIDEMDRTVQEAVREALEEQNGTTPTNTDDSTAREDSASTGTESASGQSQMQWADRDDGGDWK